MTTARDVVDALQNLAARIDGLRGQVGGAKSTVHTANGRVRGLIGSANGTGNTQVLRAGVDAFKKAEDDVDRSHDALKEAVDALKGYLDREFSRAGGGGGTGNDWTPTRDIGAAHTDAFDRSRRRALVKQAILIGATGAVAAAGVGALLGAVTAGAPLAVALGVGSVPNCVAFAVSRLREGHEWNAMRTQGASRDALRAKTKSILTTSLLDAGGWVLPPLGAVLNMKSAVEDTFDLLKMYKERKRKGLEE